jgi:cytochrome P450
MTVSEARVAQSPDGEFRYDPFSVEAMTDPLPLYRVLRDSHPVYYMPEYDTFAISRFEDVYQVLGDTSDTFQTTEGSTPSPEKLRVHFEAAMPLPPTDPIGLHTAHPSTVHGPIRQAHGRPLRPGAVGRLANDIRELIDGMLDDLLPTGEFDLVQDFAGIVAATVMCRMFRIDPSRAREILATVNASTRTDPVNGGYDFAALTRTMQGLIEPVVVRRRAEGADGSFPLVDGLLDFTLDGRPLRDDEVARQLIGVLVGGTETLPKVFAHGLWELLRAPDQLAAVRADPAVNSAKAFEEMLRFCGPAQWFMRAVHKPTEVAGVPMRPGQRVQLLIQSANRDPREFTDPDVFRWDREIPRTLAFGQGPHFCIGVHLARLEGRLLLEQWLRRVPRYEILEERAVRPPSSFQWGWTEVPVRVHRG